MFDYFKKHQEEPPRQKPIEAPHCCGKGFLVATHSSGRNCMCDAVKIKGKHCRVQVEQDLIDFLMEVQDKVHLHIGQITMKSLHKWHGQLFRGHVMFHGSVWRD